LTLEHYYLEFSFICISLACSLQVMSNQSVSSVENHFDFLLNNIFHFSKFGIIIVPTLLSFRNCHCNYSDFGLLHYFYSVAL